MQDEGKTKEQLLIELQELHKRVSELERDQAEQRLAGQSFIGSRNYLRTILQAMPDGFVVSDAGRRITEANEAYCRMSGYSLAELLLLRISDIDAVEEPAATAARIRRIIDKGSATFETCHRRKDGSIFDVEVSATYLEIGGGRFVCFCRDITESKQSEAALAESEQRFKLLYERAPMAYQSLDENGNLIEVNQVWLEALGYTKEDVIGRNFADFLDPDWVDHFKENFSRFKVMGEVLGVEFNMVRKDGSTMLVSFHGKIGRDPQGSFKQTHCTFQDITEQRRAEERLRESEQRFCLAMEATEDGLWDWNLHTDEVYYSPGYLAMLGYAPGEVPADSSAWVDRIHPDDKDAALKANMDCIENRRDDFDVEFRMQAKNGEWRWILGRGKTAGRDAGGRAARMVGTHTDITGRKLGEEALRKSEELYRSLVSLSPDAISVVDLNGLLTFVSLKAVQMFGQSPDDEILGCNLLSWVAPEDQEKASANIRHLLREGTLIDTEFTLIKKDGTRFIGEVNSAVIRSPDGSPMSFIIVTRDVTERKRAEEALLESEQKFKGFAEQSLVGIYLFQDGVFKYVNPKFAQMFGYTVEECLNDMHFRNLVYTEDVARVEELANMRASGVVEFFRHSFRGLKKNGQIFVVEVYASTSDHNGKPAAIGTILDITERKAAEDALRESEKRFNKFFRGTPVGTSISRINDGQFADINDAFLGLFGYTREEVVGQNPFKLAMYADPEDRAKMGEMLQEQGKLQDFETRLVRKSGEIRDASISAELIEVDGQQYALGLTYDITERKRGEKERKKLEEQLFQAQKMESVGRLAGGVAHDFNNMLGVIIGRAEMALQQHVSNGKLQHHLKEILKAGLRSADLTRQLLAFARKQTAIPKILDLNDTISGMLKMLRRLIAEDVGLSWQPGLDLWKVNIDPSQVDQILANLVVNARDAISGVGAITMGTENVEIDDSNSAEPPEFIPGEYVLLTVSDTGTGMSKEVRENIFEPFFTTKELGKGTGLGLSTVYGIVKQNDGFIYVASELGKGTTFKIYLPRFKAETAQVPSEEMAGKRSTGTETILLVEDDEAILDLSKIILENLGFTVLAAHTPVYALHLAEEHPGDIHLLITDVVMPEMNGRELAEQLRAIRPNLKCLYMSGYTADVIAHRGILDEGVGFIQKPFLSDNFAARVRQVLDHLE